MTIPPDEVDLAALASTIQAELPVHLRQEYDIGKTAIRDVVAARLACSEAMAEDLVDTMVERGMLRFSGDPTVVGSQGAWLVSLLPPDVS